MRGSTARQVTMLALVEPDQLIPADRPIRDVKPIVEEALRELKPVFAGMYSEVGRRSIPPEHRLKACLLVAFHSIRSERRFCEWLRYNLLFKWFLGLNVEDDAFDDSSFAQNRERLLKHNVSRACSEAVLGQGEPVRNGTGRRGDAGHGFQRWGGWAADVAAILPDAAPSDVGCRQAVRHQGLRSGLPGAGGHAARGPKHEPPVERIDSRTAGQEGYRVSQRIRKRAEEVFGWLKTVGGGRKLRYLGVRRNQLWAELAVTAFNLVRIGTLVAEPPERCSAVPGRPRPAAHTAPQPLVDVVTNAPTRLSSMPDDGKLLPRDLNSPRRRSSTPC